MIKIISSKDDFVPELPDVWDEIRDLHVESGKEGVEFGGIWRINSEKESTAGNQLWESIHIIQKNSIGK